jgi:ferrous iron transport protein A
LEWYTAYACPATASARARLTTMSSLQHVRAGASVRICRLCGDAEACARLREIGFCEDAVVRCVKTGPSMILQVANARVALSGHVAQQIMVVPA